MIRLVKLTDPEGGDVFIDVNNISTIGEMEGSTHIFVRHVPPDILSFRVQQSPTEVYALIAETFEI